MVVGPSVASQAVVAPYGTSTTCGDAIVGANEECDDGPGTEHDACSPDCHTRDQPVTTGAKTDRHLGAGRHPVAGLDAGFITAYVEYPTDEAAIGATLFNIWGQATHQVAVSSGASPIDDANPVAASLPDGSYAVAWGDFDGDGSDLGIALRRVKADGTLGPLAAANSRHEFSQLNPDILWTGSQLVVAWEDYADAETGPDLRYRLFDSDLNPLGDDLTLAASALPEAAVALAAFNGGSWAAAYREGAVDGQENVVVRVDDKVFRVGPVLGGPPEDRPGLVALDATHLLLVFSGGTDPGATGIYNVPRLRYSVIDTQSAAAPTFQALEPLDDVFSSDAQVSDLSPTVAAGYDGFYVGWRSEARVADPSGDDLWLKYLTWNPAATPQLEVRETEMSIPRSCDGSFGDQRTPALARVGLPPTGALALAWDDYSHSQGAASGEPDIVVHYAPTSARDALNGNVFTEHWTAANGTPWSSHWTTSAISGTATIDIQSNQGRINGTTVSSTLAVVNHYSAVNVDLTTRLRWSSNSVRGGLIARCSDSDPESYIAARFGTVSNDQWKLYAMLKDGSSPAVQVDIASATPPPSFNSVGINLDFYARLRVVTDAVNGSVTASAKLWQLGTQEPAVWTMQGTVPASSAIAIKLGNRPGRFGVHSNNVATGRSTTFEDFRAVFFEGSYLGDVAASVAPVLPLKRDEASSRTCTPNSKCTDAKGCCFQDADCAANLTCSGSPSTLLGLSSHARSCAPAHCTNLVLDADEVRTDCGGADCAPCSCTSTATRGGSAYCTPSCLGGVGDADCNTAADCFPGFTCGQQLGYKYGWAFGVDTCLPEHCVNRTQDSDETGPDCGGTCGSCACAAVGNGQAQHCTVWCPCIKGDGDCSFPDDCATGLACGPGARWGVGYNVCAAPHCMNNVKDADETGKDCGGADCGPVCP